MNDIPITEISPQEAWEVLQSEPDAILLDVRTSMEFNYVGHPAGAINVPWQESPDWKIDTSFVEKVQQALTKERGGDIDLKNCSVLTICRSGKRSLAAATELTNNGYSRVYNIEQGFEGDMDGEKHRSTINGWRYHNLPWEQS